MKYLFGNNLQLFRICFSKFPYCDGIKKRKKKKYIMMLIFVCVAWWQSRCFTVKLLNFVQSGEYHRCNFSQNGIRLKTCLWMAYSENSDDSKPEGKTLHSIFWDKILVRRRWWRFVVQTAQWRPCYTRFVATKNSCIKKCSVFIISRNFKVGNKFINARNCKVIKFVLFSFHFKKGCIIKICLFH